MKWSGEEDAAMLKAMQGSKSKDVSWAVIAESVPGRNSEQCRDRWVHTLDPSIRRGPWSRTEDAKLKELHALHGPNWKKLAEELEGRHHRQVRTRWVRTLDPALKFSPWTTTEDSKLIELVSKRGLSWTRIAELMGSRSDVQCRKRWVNTLDPTITKGKWSRDEDVLLAHLHPKMDGAWAMIAERIHGRSGWQCQQRWEVTLEPFIKISLASSVTVERSRQDNSAGGYEAGNARQAGRSAADGEAAAGGSLENASGPSVPLPPMSQEDELEEINKQIQVLFSRKQKLVQQRRLGNKGSVEGKLTCVNTRVQRKSPSGQPQGLQMLKRTHQKRPISPRYPAGVAPPAVEIQLEPVGDVGPTSAVTLRSEPAAPAQTIDKQGETAEKSTDQCQPEENLSKTQFDTGDTSKETDGIPLSKRALLNWDTENVEGSAAKKVKRM